MLSCDTFALGKEYYSGRQNLLGKNSDRPVGEAQPLVFAAGGEYSEQETLSCTHLTIPQARHTYSVLGSKPYWIWGFEMGANEKGLFIGNEAQGSRCAAENAEGMLGMDMLRLALERTATSREAITLIGELLQQYGQNANANLRYDRRYENSFMLVDQNEIWLMETARREWAARKIRDWAAISNCYTIETEYDLCSAGMEKTIRDNRWLSPGEPINFAKAYTLPSPRQEHSVPRWRRMQKLISSHSKALTMQNAECILRDHFEDEILAPRFGACYANFTSICMHAQDSNGAQTAASMLFTYDESLGPVFRYAPSLPCCSVYIPVYWTQTVPGIMSEAGRYFDEKSLWWNVERLAMVVSMDEDRFGESVRNELKKLETAINERTEKTEAEAKRMIAVGKKDEAFDILRNLTEKSAADLLQLSGTLADSVSSEIKASGGLYGQRKQFLEEYQEWAKMPLV